jgi:hypothetical protein
MKKLKLLLTLFIVLLFVNIDTTNAFDVREWVFDKVYGENSLIVDTSGLVNYYLWEGTKNDKDFEKLTKNCKYFWYCADILKTKNISRYVYLYDYIDLKRKRYTVRLKVKTTDGLEKNYYGWTTNSSKFGVVYAMNKAINDL